MDKTKSSTRAQGLRRTGYAWPAGPALLLILLLVLPLLLAGCSSGPSAPVLTNPAMSPLAGDESTVFAFSVTYSDADNDAPSQVKLLVDQTEYDMSKHDAGADAYSDGVVYTYSTTLPVGNHAYSFSASDGEHTGLLDRKSVV